MQSESARSSASPRPGRAAVYCRISRDGTGAGLGVDRQEKECRELADRLGATIIGVYRDNDLSAYSGKKRPEYLRMLADIEAGRVDVVLAWHTDRLHRSPTELETYIAVCEKRGVPTHTAKAGPLDLATPSGRLVARQLGAVARYEVEHAIERQKAAKQQAADAGKWSGGRRPYGYGVQVGTTRRIDRRTGEEVEWPVYDCTLKVPREAAVIVESVDAILLGTSLRTQAAKLNARGVLTSTGKPWKPTELKRVLLRPRNAGLREHRGKVIGKAVWPAVVPEEKWQAVKAILTDPERRTNVGAAPRWMLSGLARCGVCGASVIVTRIGSSRPSAPGYTCKVGKHVVRNAAELDNYVEMVLVERLRRPDAIDLLRPANPAVDLAALSAEETNLRQRLDALADNLDMDERMLVRRSQRLRERLAEIAAEKASAGQGSALSGVVDAPDPGAAWESLTLDRKRSIVSLLMEITINLTRRGRRPGWRAGQSYFDPSSVTINW